MTDDQLFDCMKQGLSQQEIASLFGLHRSTVQLRIRRLRDKLADDENNEGR